MSRLFSEVPPISGSSLTPLPRNVKQHLETTLTKPLKAPNSFFDVLGIDVITLLKLLKKYFSYSNCIRVQYGTLKCVFSSLELARVTVTSTYRCSVRQYLSFHSSQMFILTSEPHVRGNCLTSSMKHEDVYKDI